MVRSCIIFFCVALLLSCRNEITDGERAWRMADIASKYKVIPCFARPVCDAQIKKIISDVITKELPQFDTVYITLLPHRPADQIYSVTDNPTFILMRLWGSRRRNIPNIFYDPHGDSLYYLNALLQNPARD